jgi:predicted nucleotide-binding protein
MDNSVASGYSKTTGDTPNKLRKSLGFLQSVLERLELVSESVTSTSRSAQKRLSSAPRCDRVFLVHGHDVALNQSVSRFVEKLGLELVILPEQPNIGRTLIEKLEDYSDVAYAIALLTADDVAAPKDQSNSAKEWKPRARQNVIFELGVFVGKLGRGKVCALYKPGVEIPSDYKGVGYVAMDPGGGWKLELLREMRAAGLEVDLSKVA